MRRCAVVLLCAASWIQACGSPPPPQVPVTEADVASEPVVSPPAPAEAAPAPVEAAPAPSEVPSEATPAEGSPAEPATPAPAANAAAPNPSAAEPAKPPGNTVTETRTLAVIRAVVLQNRQKVRDCYEIARKQTPSLKGKLTMHFKLNPAGKVTLAELNRERSTLYAPKLVLCAAEALKQMPFPRSSRGFESEVNYPFDFKP
jgi:hypothetical protein